MTEAAHWVDDQRELHLAGVAKGGGVRVGARNSIITPSSSTTSITMSDNHHSIITCTSSIQQKGQLQSQRVEDPLGGG